MKKYEIVVTDEAVADLENIYLYIATTLLSPEIASDQYNRITSQILKLETMPERYCIIESEPDKSRGLRIMPVDNYSVLYIVDESTITVTNILYSAYDMHEKLK
ncbi:MAG: type II toxin-antitoxin system RelE/ParE family toxin [Eubacteriales bacterium]